jgi:nucleoside-diphosphate-sugar epimerase
MRKRIILTGGTGFIGSYLAYKLLKEGYEINFLARGRNHQSAQERINKALGFVDPEILLYQDQYRVIESDITKPGLGISPKDIQKFNRNIDEIWHCAASISFRAEEFDKTYIINVEGTRNILNFAAKINAFRLHYVSTAYVAGDRSDRVYENELDYGQKLRNPYEQTKLEAEKLVKEWEKKNFYQVSIYRPGIVVGNSKTGQTPSFTGYYTLARNFYLLKKAITQRLERNGEKYNKSGIFFNNGFLTLPVRIVCSPYGTVNITPVDYVIETVWTIAQDKNSIGRTFHIVNQKPPNFQWLFNTSLEILKIRGFQLIDIKNSINPSCLPGASTNGLIKELELEIMRNCGVYLPYICGEPLFDIANVKQLAPLTAHVPITKETLETLLRYAIDTNFGKHQIKDVNINISAAPAIFSQQLF